MTETRTCRALFILLRTGLWGRREKEATVFPLSEEEWEEVYGLACRHTIEGIVYDGILMLSVDKRPVRSLLVKWTVAVERIECANKQTDEVLKELQILFRQHGLRAVLLKGQGVAAFYRTPSHRVCGDIDFYFPDRNDLERANRLIEEKGIRLVRKSKGESHYSWKGIVIEHHGKLIDIYDPFRSSWLRKLEEREGYKEDIPSPVLNLLVINTHILKHLLVTGIGLRQLCDMARACVMLQSLVDGKKMNAIYERAGIRKWTRLLNDTLVRYIGLPKEYVEGIRVDKSAGTEKLMERILLGGNFGHYRKSKKNFLEMRDRERLLTIVKYLPGNFFFFSRYAFREALWRPLRLVFDRLPTSFMERSRWLWNISNGYRGRIASASILDLAGMTLSLLSIYWSKRAIDIATGAVEGELFYPVIGIVVFMSLAVLFGLASPWITERVRIRLKIHLQKLFSDTLMMGSWTDSGRWHTGDLLTRMNDDCEEVVRQVVYTFPSTLVTGIKLLASFIFLSSIDVQLAWILLAMTPLIFLSKLYYKKLRFLSKAGKEADSRILSVLQESMAGRMLIRSLDAVEVRRTKLQGIQERKYTLEIEQLKFSTFSRGVLRGVFVCGYLTAFLWGVYRLDAGLISFGSMTAFLQLTSRIQGPALSLVSFIPAFIRVRTSVERLMELSLVEQESVEARRLEGTPEIILRNVSFGYGKEKVLQQIDLNFQPAMATAVIGPTGAGKTTLVRLLLGLVRPEQGTAILKLQEEQHELSSADRVNFLYVPQGNSLFSGTIRENLLLAAPKAREEEMRQALESACADFVSQLPKGIDTLIGEQGYGLSEGQAQRIAIARSLLKPGNVWVFDEVTSALDRQITRKLIDNLMEKGRDKTLLFITHDPIVMEACDSAIYMDKDLKKYNFRVAGLLFAVWLPSICKVEALLPSFREFREESESEEELLFSLTVVPHEVLADYPETEALEEFDNDLGHLLLARTRGGYRIDLGWNAGARQCRMVADTAFTHLLAGIDWGDKQAGETLNSFLRIAFSQAILRVGGIALHASVVVKDGDGYLFMGKSGTGKSTHGALWMENIPGTELLNDDNPVVRVTGNGDLKVYGTPWSGKTPCYKNRGVKVKGMVLLKQASVNQFEERRGVRAFAMLLPSCSVIREDKRLFELLCSTLEQVVQQKIMVGFFRCKPDKEAALTCFKQIKN